MMKYFYAIGLLLYAFSAFSQQKLEEEEFIGTVIGLRPGWGFAYEIIELQLKDEMRSFSIDPHYGQSILSQLKPGQPLTLKAMVNNARREAYKKRGKDMTVWGFRLTDKTIAVKLNEQWIETPPIVPLQNGESREAKIFLEKKVVGDYHLDGVRKGLVFENGLVAFQIFAQPGRFSMEKISVGGKVSFFGFESSVHPDYLYPITGVKEVFSFDRLTRMDGQISAYIYKQNYVRIGAVIEGKRLSFPAEYAKQIEQIAARGNITVYYAGTEDKEANLLPTIHALIQGRDTLYFTRLYYGGPDGNHDFVTTKIKGKIARINRSESGRIVSIILGNDCYLEVDPRVEEQLGNLLKKGNELEVEGRERVKKEGEIYEKNYRIITPERMVAGDKEFILNR